MRYSSSMMTIERKPHMQRVLFICHGNICRSTMAESVFTELVQRAGRAGEFVIDSAATSTEEIGNPPHHARLPSCVKSGFPSLRTVPVRCVARSMATGITLSIWMLRTRVPASHLWRRLRRQDYALARLDRAPRRRGRSLVHRQLRCHLPRRARRLHGDARAAVGKRGRGPRLRREMSVDNLPHEK